MKKTEFLSKLSEKSGITKGDAKIFYDNFTDIVSEIIKSEGIFELQGICVFKVKDVPAKTLTCTMGEHKGEKYRVPAKKKISVSISSRIKDKINGKHKK